MDSDCIELVQELVCPHILLPLLVLRKNVDEVKEGCAGGIDGVIISATAGLVLKEYLVFIIIIIIIVIIEIGVSGICSWAKWWHVLGGSTVGNTVVIVSVIFLIIPASCGTRTLWIKQC